MLQCRGLRAAIGQRRQAELVAHLKAPFRTATIQVRTVDWSADHPCKHDHSMQDSILNPGLALQQHFLTG